MPMTTKMPTHRSIAERFMRLLDAYAAEHENGQDEVEREDRQRARDDGARRGRRNAFGGRLRVVAFEHRDQADRDAEHDALDDAVGDVAAGNRRADCMLPQNAPASMPISLTPTR